MSHGLPRGLRVQEERNILFSRRSLLADGSACLVLPAISNRYPMAGIAF
jgi:hypothetical protein